MSNNVEVRGVARLQMLGRVTQVLYTLMAITNALLVIRILLAQAGANEANALVQFVFSVTDVLLIPFAGIITGDNAALYTPIIAIIVYSVLVTVIVQVLSNIFGRPPIVTTKD
jgi:uncharacterized protein YggT (Ycf19 family)